MPSFLPYGKQSIDDADVQAISDVMRAERITRGPQVEAFEAAVANYCGAQYAVAFSSGSAALHAAAFAAGIQAGDRIITTPNSFVATVAAGMERQATPIFVDIDGSTGNLNLEQVGYTLEDRVTTRGRTVVMPVHFAGIPVEMEQLDRLIQSPDVMVIEDAAHALGSTYSNGQRVGCCAWSAMTVFSFHPVKTITTGEGGMVTTNERDLYHRLRLFRHNGIERDPAYMEIDPPGYYEGYYEVQALTSNTHLTEFQAALGLSQLKRIDQFVDKRRQLMAVYRRLFTDMPHVQLLSSPNDAQVAFHLCVAQIDFPQFNTTRAQVMTLLQERGIGSQVHYIPLYRHPFFVRQSGDLSEYFPHMEVYFARTLSLPLYYDLTEKDVEFVVSTLKEILLQEQQKKPVPASRHRHRRRR